MQLPFRKRNNLKMKLHEIPIGSPIIEMKGITKRFSEVIANNNITFEVRRGEIHALLGENGAGKTTLMKILFGLYQLDEGKLFVKGTEYVPKSPRDAIAYGIGMVQQHFALVSKFSVTENIILGLKSSKEPLIEKDSAEKKISKLSKEFGLNVDPRSKVWQLSVGEQQRVEILKALYRDVDILILDEPTAVLTPQEVEYLFETLKSMVRQGLTIIFITHKLPEVFAASHRVTVLRQGKKMETLDTADTNEKQLARLMVGRDIINNLSKKNAENNEVILEVKNLTVLDDRKLPKLKNVSFQLKSGEILGFAGVAGNGQRELAESITGLRKSESGKVIIQGKDMTNKSPVEFLKRGLAYIPEDRRKTGIVLDFTVAENSILTSHSVSPFAEEKLTKFLNFHKINSPIDIKFLNFHKINSHVDRLIEDYDIMVGDRNAPTKNLSGGNMQKLILARELSRNPRLIIANKPTRGLDVGSTEFIRRKLIESREKGSAVLVISEDLDEIFSLSDRIAVM
jgi:ABC-type uncharacterized transport system ATPase subunit